MISPKKKPTLILLLTHVFQFLFVAGVLFVVYSKSTAENEVLTAVELAALKQKNITNALIVGLASSLPGFLVWQFYLLPKISKGEVD